MHFLSIIQVILLRERQRRIKKRKKKHRYLTRGLPFLFFLKSYMLVYLPLPHTPKKGSICSMIEPLKHLKHFEFINFFFHARLISKPFGLKK